MVEQTGEEIDWDRIPPDAEDFPESVSRAVNIFYTLGDRIYGDVGYVGKDFTNLDLLLELYGIETTHEKDWCLEILMYLDGKQIKASQKKLKAEIDKIRKK
tara:strand:+ start:149 stop:451 length:303 start_codon:yes stop_codon:yes gene_type:complete